MHLTLNPQNGLPDQPEMTIHVAGDVITIDGTAHDLASVPEGGEGWPEGASPFVAPITRNSGVISCTVVARLGDTATQQQDGPWTLENAAGDIEIPARRHPTQEDKQ